MDAVCGEQRRRSFNNRDFVLLEEILDAAVRFGDDVVLASLNLVEIKVHRPRLKHPLLDRFPDFMEQVRIPEKCFRGDAASQRAGAAIARVPLDDRDF
jgi:hypothetical protein